MSEERLQSLVVELRILEAYYNEVNARQALLVRVMTESRAAIEAVKAFPQSGTSDILVPIGGGVFLEAQAPAPDYLVVNVGADVAIRKSRESTISFLEERLAEVEKAVSSLEAQKADLTRKIEMARNELSQLVEKLRQGQG
ncbi:MAG: prefoldin subunit alpha [Nitrososphaerota archaeon]